MTGRTRVVWLTPVAPDHHGGGGQLRTAHLLDALAASADVHLVTEPVRDLRVRQVVASLTEVHARADEWSARPRLMRRGRDLWLALGSSQPREVAAFAPVRGAMAPVVERLVRQADPDVVLVDFAGLAPLVALASPGGRDDGRRSPWVLTLHNLASRMAAQQAEVARGRRQAWLYRRDAASARRWEQRVPARYDGVVVTSSADADVLPFATTVIPNGVDLARFGSGPVPPDPRVAFTGALYTAPNVDGATWLVERVWPLVRAEVPDATLAVVGSRPVQRVRDLAGAPGLTLHFDVPDVEPHLRAARVALVPLRIGSGTRLKALEALAAGRPVVGTSVGLEDLGLRAGEDVLVADDVAGFARAVVRLLRDDALALRLAAAGRQVVVTRYDWAPIGRRFTEMVLDRARQPPPEATQDR